MKLLVALFGVVALLLALDVQAGPGEKVYEGFKEQGALMDDPEWAAYVQAVGERLIAVSARPKAKTRFLVVDRPDVNAEAWPDGYIFVYRGLLTFMESEDQLASVLGHEIGHNLANHYSERVGRAGVGNVAGWVAYIVTGIGAMKTTTDALTAVMVSGYGREQELEADRIGAELLAKAGYDPYATIEIMQVLKDQESLEKLISGGRRSYHGLFSSHPATDKRLHDIVEASYRYQGEVVEPIGDFWALVDGLVYGDEATEGMVKDATFYHSVLRFVVTFPKDWSIVNQTQRVYAQAPGGNAVGLIELSGLNFVKGQSPKEYVEKTLMRDDVLAGEEIDVNGFKAYIAPVDVTGSSAKAAWIAVLFKGETVYYFKGEAGEKGDAKAFADAFRSTVESFRAMQAKDIQDATRQRIRVIEAKPGDTYRSLARQSAFKTHGEEMLRLMNGDYPVREPRPGDLIKIVQ